VSIEEAEKMKKIAKVLMSITCLVLLTVFTTGCADKIDKKTLRQEQERLAEYTIQKFEGVKKIEFTSFEQNTSSRLWSVYAVINDNIKVSYTLDNVGKNSDISMVYNMEKLKKKKQKTTDENTENIEIKFVER
jgi:complete genome